MDGGPRYVIRASEVRVLIPEVVKISFLCAVLYAGVWVNAFLLGWEIPLPVNLLILAVILVLLALELIIQYVRTKKTRMEIYLDRAIIYVRQHSETVLWAQAQPAELKRNIIDKMFSTATIVLDGVDIHYIRHPEQMQKFIEQYRQYGAYAARQK